MSIEYMRNGLNHLSCNFEVRIKIQYLYEHKQGSCKHLGPS